MFNKFEKAKDALKKTIAIGTAGAILSSCNPEEKTNNRPDDVLDDFIKIQKINSGTDYRRVFDDKINEYRVSGKKIPEDLIYHVSFQFNRDGDNEMVDIKKDNEVIASFSKMKNGVWLFSRGSLSEKEALELIEKFNNREEKRQDINEKAKPEFDIIQESNTNQILGKYEDFFLKNPRFPDFMTPKMIVETTIKNGEVVRILCVSRMTTKKILFRKDRIGNWIVHVEGRGMSDKKAIKRALTEIEKIMEDPNYYL